MDDVYAYYVSLPMVRGVTVMKCGDYIVFINESLSIDERKITLKHEIRHINYNHLYDDCMAITACEHEASLDVTTDLLDDHYKK